VDVFWLLRNLSTRRRPGRLEIGEAKGVRSRFITFPCYTKLMEFEVIGEITAVETIAVGSSIREIDRLRKVYGTGGGEK
jgi:hypothetical protein